MKKLLLIIAVSVLCVATQAADPVYANKNTLVQNIGIAASTGTNFVTAIVIPCKQQKDVTLQITSTNTVATGQANTIKYFILRSIDGTTYDTTGNIHSYTPNGTTAVTVITNIPTYGCGYLKILWVTNAAEASTNVGALSISYAIKTGAP